MTSRLGAISRRLCRGGAERGSMAILMMVMLVGLTLSALIVPMVITQARTTRSDNTRLEALDAAQAGIDVALGLIRASVDSGNIGNSLTLPCETQSGFVNSNGPVKYSVTIEYFTVDPLINSSTAKMLCPIPPSGSPGSGPFDPGSGHTTPSFARFTSIGTVGTATDGFMATRTLTSTYAFRTSNVNLLGGTIRISGAALCMDVEAPTPAVGSLLELQLCSTSTPPVAKQVFAYRSDLTLQLPYSITPTNPDGLCVNSAHTPAVDAEMAQLSRCGPLGTPATFTEQWSYNDSGQYQAAAATSAADGILAPLCLNASASATQKLITGSCGSQWVLSPAVGPGAAASVQQGAGAHQWVNYGEFGRCLELTGGLVASAYMINYPCKQNPFPGILRWNQVFTSPPIATGASNGSGQIFAVGDGTRDTTSGTKYCLTTPTVSGNYVLPMTCADGNIRQIWTIYNGDPSLTYSQKYRIVNLSLGIALCLGLISSTDIPPGVSKIDAEPCSGDKKQKWNATANFLNSTQRNIIEK